MMAREKSSHYTQWQWLRKKRIIMLTFVLSACQREVEFWKRPWSMKKMILIPHPAPFVKGQTATITPTCVKKPVYFVALLVVLFSWNLFARNISKISNAKKRRIVTWPKKGAEHCANSASFRNVVKWVWLKIVSNLHVNSQWARYKRDLE